MKMKIKLLNRKTILQFSLVILAIFAIRMWQQADLIHGQAPVITSTTITGDIISSNPLPDEAILVHFWATWCQICSLENDNIQAISDDYKTLNIAMQSGSDADIIKYANANGLKLDNIINDNSGSLSRIFGIKGTPTSFIINSSGQIKFIEVGYTTEIGLRVRLWWAGL